MTTVHKLPSILLATKSDDSSDGNLRNGQSGEFFGLDFRLTLDTPPCKLFPGGWTGQRLDRIPFPERSRNEKMPLYDPTQFVERALFSGCDGTSADEIVCTVSPQLNDSAEKLDIGLSSVEYFIRMAIPQGKCYVAKETANSFVAFAIYPHSNACPVSRLYFLRLPNDGMVAVAVALEMQGVQVISLADWNELAVIADVQGASERISAWKAAHQSPRHELAEELACGRHENTFVDETIYLSDDNCLICNDPVTRLVSSSVGSVDGKGTALMVGLCSNHAEEALRDDEFVISYIARKFGLEMPWSVKTVDLKTDEEYFQDAIRLVTDMLKCSIVEEPNPVAREVKGKRSSGFKVIVRIQSEVKRGYGYMVLDPEGNHVGRIDDAPDHPDLRIRWDHLHTGLPKTNKTAEPSYTFGHAVIDAKAILAMIEKAERDYLHRNGKQGNGARRR